MGKCNFNNNGLLEDRKKFLFYQKIIETVLLYMVKPSIQALPLDKKILFDWTDFVEREKHQSMFAYQIEKRGEQVIKFIPHCVRLNRNSRKMRKTIHNLNISVKFFMA